MKKLKSKRMQAMCIKSDIWFEEGTNMQQDGPAYGDIVTILRDYDAEYYVLAEYAFPAVYWKDNFIPIGNYDERDRLEAYQDAQSSFLDAQFREIIKEVEEAV